MLAGDGTMPHVGKHEGQPFKVQSKQTVRHLKLCETVGTPFQDTLEIILVTFRSRPVHQRGEFAANSECERKIVNQAEPLQAKNGCRRDV